MESKKAVWTKVIYLKPGDEIAVQNGETIAWQKITSIEYAGEEQVWDIEVENTHNFVANGIIAHNTYISGMSASGRRVRVGLLDLGQSVTAASAGTYYTAKLNNSYTGTMASATPVTSIYGLYNRPNIGIGGTSPQLNSLFVDYISANVGIGTTSVVSNLYNLYIAAPTTNDGSSVTNSYALVTEANAGNVGIGTTGPGYKLQVIGDGNVSTSLTVGTSLSVGTTTTTASLNLSSTAIGNSSVAAFLSGNSGLLGYLGYQCLGLN